MSLPPAYLILFFLSSFVGLWGASVILRGWHGRVDPSRLRCPACQKPIPDKKATTCPHCDYVPRNRSALYTRHNHWSMIWLGVVASAIGLSLVPLGYIEMQWETSGYSGTIALHPLHAVMAGMSVFGIVLTIWGWRGNRSRGKRRCPKCLYDMTGIVSTDTETQNSFICPECGTHIEHTADMYRPKRRMRVAGLGVVLVVLSLYGQTIPRALRNGPVGLIPTTVLIAGIGILPSGLYVNMVQGAGNTLMARSNNGDMWHWQEEWIDRRTHTMAHRKLSLRALANAASVVKIGKSDEAYLLLMQCSRYLSQAAVPMLQNKASTLSNAIFQCTLYEPVNHKSPERLQLETQIKKDMSGLTAHLPNGNTNEIRCVCQLLDFVPELSDNAIRLLVKTCTINSGRSGIFSPITTLIKHSQLQPKALTALIDLIKSSDSQTSQIAVQMVVGQAMSIDSATPNPLIALVETESDPATLFLLGKTCARYNPSQMNVSLSTWFLHSDLPLPFLRGYATNAMHNTNAVLIHKTLVPRFMPLLLSDDPEDVFAVLFFLDAFVDSSEMVASGWTDEVVELLKRPDPDIHAEAAKLLVDLLNAKPNLTESVREAIDQAGLEASDIPADLRKSLE